MWQGYSELTVWVTESKLSGHDSLSLESFTSTGSSCCPFCP